MSEPLVGRLRSVTVRRASAGHWFATFTADGVPALEAAAATHPVIGIDLGLKDSAVLSTGDVIAAPKHLAAKLAQLRRYQRSYSGQARPSLRGRRGGKQARPRSNKALAQ